MILRYGPIEQIQGSQWYMLEVRSERTVENVIRRIGKAMPDIFKDGGCCEIFVPISNRDLNVFNLQTSSYIFVRSDRKTELQKFKGITGVVGLVCKKDPPRLQHAILVDDDYVQDLIRTTERDFISAPETISEGSFVRVLDGLDKGFCGHVVSIDNEYALVKVELKTRQMFLETPLRNLKDLSNVPESLRVFYYCDLVEEFGEECDFTPDLTYTQEVAEPIEEEEPPEQKVKFGRQKTVTALTKKLLSRGERDPKTIIKEALKAIEAKEIKCPKSAFIFYSILKQAILETLFSDDERIKTYKDVVKIHGDGFRFSPKMIADLDRHNVLPKRDKETSEQTQ